MMEMKIINFDTVDSTNAEAKRLATLGEPEGTVIIADHQTAGRGRFSRYFFSPEGTGLYMSIVLRPLLKPQDALLITTAAAVAVCRAADALFGLNTEIKWVNDIMLGGKKVCGILTESALDTKTGMLAWAVLGIGVNLCPPKDGFPRDIENTAGFLCNECDKNKKQTFAERIITEFFTYYEKLEDRLFFEEYRSRLTVTGKKINILRGDTSTPAVAVDIDKDFHLIAEYTDGKRESLSSGEVSIRL